MKYYKFAVQKFYFEKGYGVSSYVKYLIALFGLSSLDVTATLILGFGYAFFCYFLGRWMYKSGFSEAEKAVENAIDPFVKKMLANKKFK